MAKQDMCKENLHPTRAQQPTPEHSIHALASGTHLCFVEPGSFPSVALRDDVQVPMDAKIPPCCSLALDRGQVQPDLERLHGSLGMIL